MYVYIFTLITVINEKFQIGVKQNFIDPPPFV